MYLIDCWLGCITSRLIGAATVMWPSGLSSDVGGSVLIYFRWSRMKSVLAGRDEQISFPLSLSLSTSRDWSYLPQSRSIFHHQCVRGKAIKPALLFLSITRISTRFSEIPPRALEILGIFPLKCFLMGCSEVSETLVRLQCSFWISVYLFGAEMTKFEVRVHLNFPHK